MHFAADNLTTLLDLATGDPKTAISTIEVHTAWGPPIVINEPFKPSAEKAKAGFDPLRVLKPKIVLRVRGASKAIVATPYGDPGPTKWGYVQLGIVGFCGLILYYVISNQRRCRP